MYTGTMIQGLMAVVEAAERGALRKKFAEEQELQRMFELQIQFSHRQDERLFAGAA
jgi:hypothetical protein